MSIRNYIQSAIIFLATGYLLWSIFAIHWFEVLLLMLLMIICVVHTMDVRDDLINRRALRILKKRENGKDIS